MKPSCCVFSSKHINALNHPHLLCLQTHILLLGLSQMPLISMMLRHQLRSAQLLLITQARHMLLLLLLKVPHLPLWKCSNHFSTLLSLGHSHQHSSFFQQMLLQGLIQLQAWPSPCSSRQQLHTSLVASTGTAGSKCPGCLCLRWRGTHSFVSSAQQRLAVISSSLCWKVGVLCVILRFACSQLPLLVCYPGANTVAVCISLAATD